MRDHRAEFNDRRVRAPRPVTLAWATQLHGRSTIRVAEARPFTKLRSNSGRTKLDKVLIEYANGGTQVVASSEILVGNKSLTIDLAGFARSINEVILVGNTGWRSSLDVVAI